MIAILKRILGWVVLAVVVVFGLQLVASESGEVVVLRTFSNGETQETRLWVVDDRGLSWLRSGSPEAGWYQRLRENPDVQVERDSQRHEYRAFPVEGGPAVDRINALMLEKYGWAEDLIGFMFDRSDAVAIRLDPR